jgi:hypothetical protein
MKRAGERTKFRTWGIVAVVLIGVLAFGGCGPEGGDIDAVDTNGVGGSIAEPAACPAGAAGAPAADTGTEAPSDRDCTVAQFDGQTVCKLKSGRVCATNDECASAVCKTIVVPPDPSDPYDLGYAYTGCE